MTRRDQRIRQFAGYWLVFLFCLWPIVTHAGGLGFAPLVILMGSAGWSLWALFAREIVSDLRFCGGLAFFLIWMALTSIWGSHGPSTALRLAVQVGFMASIPVLIHLQTDRTRTILSHVMMATALAGAIVLTLDVGSGYSITTLLHPVGPNGDLVARQGVAEMNIGRGLLVYALMAPLLIALFATRLPRDLAIAAIVTFLTIILIGSLLNRLSVPFIVLAGALPMIWLGYKYPRQGLRLSLSGGVISILFSPFIGLISRHIPDAIRSTLPLSWEHRLLMWDFSLAKIQERPILGHGLESARSMNETFTARNGVEMPFISLHPHNIGLQTWMELGAVGALLLCVALINLSTPMSRYTNSSPWRSGALCGGLVGITLAGLVTVGAWQYWWWAVLGLVIFMIPLIPAGPMSPDMDKKDGLISVVMVSYRTGPTLFRSLSALLSDPDIDDIYLMDNGNDPGTRKTIMDWRDERSADTRLHLVQGHGNIGFGRACNYGAQLSRGPYLLFINPDAITKKGPPRDYEPRSKANPARVWLEDVSEGRTGRSNVAVGAGN